MAAYHRGCFPGSKKAVDRFLLRVDKYEKPQKARKDPEATLKTFKTRAKCIHIIALVYKSQVRGDGNISQIAVKRFDCTVA